MRIYKVANIMIFFINNLTEKKRYFINIIYKQTYSKNIKSDENSSTKGVTGIRHRR